MLSYPTPHIHATPDQIAETVLMPGDPLRSRYIAENFLEDPVLFNHVRGVNGYTGTYRGERVSVMASGMGMPSIAIYSEELYSVFGVKHILRVGSAGAMNKSLKIRDIVIALGASTDSNFATQYGIGGTFAPIASYSLIKAVDQCAARLGISPHFGNVFSSDIFYHAEPDIVEKRSAMGILAVEMECAALYTVAARHGKEALGILTISDHLLTGENTTAEERQTSFNEMITLALETAITL